MACIARPFRPGALVLLAILAVGVGGCDDPEDYECWLFICVPETDTTGLYPASTPPPAPTPKPWPRPTPPPGPCTAGSTTTVYEFSLPAGLEGSMPVGMVRADNGPLSVTLDYSGDFIILVRLFPAGTESYSPWGGRPGTASFTIPEDFPAGWIYADVYFNSAHPQPPGDANGTMRFEYNALCEPIPGAAE